MSQQYSMIVHKNIEYARVGVKLLLLDLYLPKDAEDALPLIVWVHGGAWRAGDKEYCPAARLTARGYAVASIEYRLSQEAIFPAQIEDCKGAVRWLRAHAAQYRLDPQRIGAWGASAGGHLVALLGTAGDVKDLEGTVGGNLEYSSRVQAVCDYFGPTDFLQMIGQPGDIDRALPNAPEAALLGGLLRERPDAVKAANPITYIRRDNPPFLILHGDCDRTVPLNQSQLLYNALTAAGVPATLHIISGAGHGIADDSIKDNLQIDEHVNVFFDRYLKE
ncbi:MAG: alpha/beta hydrolase fold domain-containing protein [Armatimonadota bacterium]